jgi:hypothetical protein
MQAENGGMTDEAEIRGLIADWVKPRQRHQPHHAALRAGLGADSQGVYRMTFRHIAIGALAGLAGVFSFVAVTARAQEPPRPDQLVDALNGVFGKHPATALLTPRAFA